MGKPWERTRTPQRRVQDAVGIVQPLQPNLQPSGDGSGLTSLQILSEGGLSGNTKGPLGAQNPEIDVCRAQSQQNRQLLDGPRAVTELGPISAAFPSSCTSQPQHSSCM